MEFQEVLRRRRMVRTFHDRPIDQDVIERILDAGNRGPSAGFTQGYALLVFEGPEETGRFWEVAMSGAEQDDSFSGIRLAPLIVVPLASKKAYLDRYAEPDKGWTDRDEARWPVPYWDIDTGFASMLILLAAVDEGLGALFFGLYPPEEILAKFRSLGVPAAYEPIGAIAIGHAAPDPIEGSRWRGRKPLDAIVHRAVW